MRIKEKEEMVYAIGVLGFLGGFIAGQMMLYFFLCHKTKEQLLKEAHLKWTYGVFNWLMAIVGCYSFIQVYELYF